ncbi:MAG: peptidase T [Clostridiales bacterium]|jgi:tripeptide aminopeptidase|nr:peptidase T [Clostridiales bacterium]
MNKALDRFLRFTSIDTTSDENAAGTPSSKGQWQLAEILKNELQEMRVEQVTLDENCYVYGKIPANAENQPVIALIAHLDTADAVPGRVFKPRVAHFNGEDLVLNPSLGIKLSKDEFPVLDDYIGQDLVVTDGTTVLGADDKAGIVEILSAADILLANPDIKHGDVWLVFTPDEEIGSGAELLKLDFIKADFGYTVDGGALNEIEYENFNAASARVTIKGRNVHPGYAKGMMINAAKLAMQYHHLLPKEQTPEETEHYQGFFHLRNIQGNEENAVMDYLIRDHDARLFDEKKRVMQQAAETLNKQYGAGTVELNIVDSYRNMVEMVQKVPHVIERAEKAIRACGMEPVAKPIRGGTDGARLSFRGLPCPNLGTGGINWHSVYEFLPVNALNQMAEVLVEIVRF